MAKGIINSNYLDASFASALKDAYENAQPCKYLEYLQQIKPQTNLKIFELRRHLV